MQQAQAPLKDLLTLLEEEALYHEVEVNLDDSWAYKKSVVSEKPANVDIDLVKRKQDLVERLQQDICDAGSGGSVDMDIVERILQDGYKPESVVDIEEFVPDCYDDDTPQGT